MAIIKTFSIAHNKAPNHKITVNITKSKKGNLDIDYTAGNIDVRFIMSKVTISDNYCPTISDLFKDEKILEQELRVFLEMSGYVIL